MVLVTHDDIERANEFLEKFNDDNNDLFGDFKFSKPRENSEFLSIPVMFKDFLLIKPKDITEEALKKKYIELLERAKVYMDTTIYFLKT